MLLVVHVQLCLTPLNTQQDDITLNVTLNWCKGHTQRKSNMADRVDSEPLR